jgi:hypothetical protein
VPLLSTRKTSITPELFALLMVAGLSASKQRPLCMRETGHMHVIQKMDLLEPSGEKFSGIMRRGEVIPQDRPPDCEKFATDLNFHISNVLDDDVCLSQEGEDDLVWRIWKVWSRKERDGECAKVLTMYKRKDRKVNPGDAPLYGGVKPGGGPLDWIESVTGKKVNAGKVVPRGSRITPERLAAMGWNFVPGRGGTGAGKSVVSI